jgi:hypothetical protein
VVIASAVVPTLIAGFAFMPRHLLSERVEVAPWESETAAEEG